jgi:hypothetical protein
VVDEIQAADEEEEGRGYEELRWGSHEIDDDSENWAGRVEDDLYNFDNGENEGVSMRSINDWMDTWVRENIDKVIDNYKPSLDTETMTEIGMMRDSYTEEIDDPQKVLDILHSSGYDVADDMRQEARSDFEEAAEEAAEQEYMNDPYIRIEDEGGSGLLIYGNDDLGYDVRTGRTYSEVVIEAVSSINEAQIQAQIYAEENDLLDYEGSNEDEESVAKWSGYEMEGDHDNYREIKLRLPQLNTSYYDDHFPDRNLFAFLRVDDRDLDTGVEATPAPESFEIEHKIIPPSGIITTREFVVTRKDTGEVLYSRMIPESYTDEQIKKQTDRLSKVGEGVIPGHQVHSEGRLIPASKNKGGSSTYFIDEFQSGYHQKGNKVGYVTQDEKFTTEEIKDQFHSADDKFIRSRPIGIGEKLEKIKERMLAVEAFRPSTGDTFASLFYEFANWKAHSSQILGAKVNRQIKAIKKDVREIYNQSVEGAELLRLTGERIRLEANLPIAPFKDDAWITLGLKRAIVDAAEQGYEAIAWPDSEVLVSRWHKEYRSAYQEQYDKKMPSIVKKLTGQKPKHFDLLGNVMEDKPKNPDNLPEGYDVRQGGSSDFELSIGEGKAVKEGWRGVRLPESRDEGEDYVEVTSSVYETKEEALDWVFEHEDMYATSGTQGYHIIEITDELREKITADGFPLFQSGDGPRGYFDPGTGEATFTNNSDLSTFLHEASHYFFILLQESAQSSDEVAKDIGTLEKWFLDNGADSYVMRQEMFASGMETYMMEGKAPIPELRPLFAKFKSWLLFVYESLRKSNPFAANDLGGVQLSDEVRNVFDRMLASQEAIDQARADNSYDAMPVNEMGLDLKTIAQYHDLGEQAKAEADNELTKELLGEISREKKKWWKAGVKEYAAQVEKEINERKEYVARDYLSGKRIPEGGEAVKLNAEYLTEFYDSDSRKKLKKMSSKDGANPEQLARYFGYASGDEMIQALLGTMNEKDRKASIMAEAEARMLDEHGSTMHDFGKKENKAQETVHNEKQAELLARELQILNKKIGKDFATKGTPKDVRGIYKAQAEEDVTRVSVGRLKPNLHLANERKHGGESYRFAAQGKFVEARDAKHKQIRQFYMYREALKVKEQAEKNVVRLKGWQKKKFNPKTVNPDFIKHVKELLEGYHFGNKIGEERKARLSSETLEAWAEQQEKKYGASFHISAELDRALTKENYNDLTSGEIQGLHDTVKSVLSQGRKYSDAEKLQFNSLMARITNGVDNNATQQLRVPKERSLLDDIGRLGRLIMAEHRTVESLSLEMDGEEFGGEVMTEVYLRLKRADDNYIDRGMKAGRELNDIFNMYSPKEKLKFYNKTYIRELGESLSLSARLSFALNMGNAGNVDAMMNEYSGEEVEAVLSTLTDKDWDVVEAIWTNIDQYWNDTKDASGRVIAYGISTIEEKTTGVKPEKVEAVPFITPSGRKVRGGYYPLVADPRRSEAGKKDWDQSQTLDGFLSKGRAKASTKHGSTIERVGFGSNRFVWLDLGVVFGHVDGVIKDIEMREAVAETNRIVTDERFRNSVMRAKGEEFHDVFEEWVKSTVGSIEQPLDFWDNVAHWARAGVSLAEMGLSPRTMLQQPFGLTQTVAIIGEKYTAIGVAKFMAGRGDAARAAFELSAFLRNRASTFNRDVRDAHNSLGVKGLHEDIVTAAFWGIQKLDMAVSVPTWLGAYEKAMDDGLTGQLAVDFADSVVIRGQGGGLPRNLSKVQNRKGLIRALTMFYSFFGAYYNLQTNMWKGTSFKNPKQALKYARNQVWVTIIPALLIDYLFNGGPEEDEDEWIWALKTQLGYLAGGLIGLRDIANSATTGFDYQITPAGNVFAAPLDFYEQVKQGDLDAALVKSGTMTASYVFHVPGGRAVARASDVIMDEGTSELDSFEGWWRLLVQGKKR